jgi:predicted RNA polymerase sigma factor
VKYVPAIKAHLFDQLGRSTYAERARLRALVLTASVVERELLPIRGREL